MDKGQHTETFLSVILSCQLCTFVLPVRDTSCIHPGTFNIALFMALGIVYCLSSATLVSIYRVLNEISCSSHLGMTGGSLSWPFLLRMISKKNLTPIYLMVRPPLVQAW